ncbi:putative two-component response regulator ARR21 [Raphanus sativus]|uniref:Two-component response regulator ARR21 n=1 Tax=Raphanus sativus TaxID=3726 RepID=A0A9W3D3A4_RAPSA|nr:putative two-component response regulator ARR21 [Raphanus sativus]
MVFDLPFYDHMNITVLVVDDDPIFLSIIPNMLKNPSYKDTSFGEITVMTANDSSEAVHKLIGECNNIDIVITDYHIPGLNGLQLKKKIKEEFGNLPVIGVRVFLPTYRTLEHLHRSNP